MKNLFENFLNLIYKKRCIVCGCSKEDDFLCKTCSKDVQFLPFFAHRIYKGCPIYSMAIYDKSIKKIIQKLKFSFKIEGSKVLSSMLFEYFNKLEIKKDDLIIIYPNTFSLKKYVRGYNSTYLVAKEFSKLSNIQVIKDFILKVKYTKPQYKAKNRTKNIKNSFKINPKKLDLTKDKTLLLIDDITTSGATINEIIDILKENKINNIVCLTVAKAKY